MSGLLLFANRCGSKGKFDMYLLNGTLESYFELCWQECSLLPLMVSCMMSCVYSIDFSNWHAL